VSCGVGVGSRFLVLDLWFWWGRAADSRLVGAGVAVPVVHIDSGLRLLVWSWDHLVVSFTVTSSFSAGGSCLRALERRDRITWRLERLLSTFWMCCMDSFCASTSVVATVLIAPVILWEKRPAPEGCTTSRSTVVTYVVYS
jgi:hypothetical protein